MKKNTIQNIPNPIDDLNKYPIYRGSVKHQLGPHTVEEIENPEWYEQVMASLIGDFSEDKPK